MARCTENSCVGSLVCILLWFLPRQTWGPWHLSSFFFFSLTIPLLPVGSYQCSAFKIWASFSLSYPRFTPCPKVTLITFLLVVYFGHIGLIWGNVLSILIYQRVSWISQGALGSPLSGLRFLFSANHTKRGGQRWQKRPSQSRRPCAGSLLVLGAQALLLRVAGRHL